jgi:hypothetical protein
LRDFTKAEIGPINRGKRYWIDLEERLDVSNATNEGQRFRPDRQRLDESLSTWESRLSSGKTPWVVVGVCFALALIPPLWVAPTMQRLENRLANLEAPRTDTPVLTMKPMKINNRVRQSARTQIDLAKITETAVISLQLHRPNFDLYDLYLYRDGVRTYESKELGIDDRDCLNVTVSRRWLQAGEYDFRVFGVEPDGERLEITHFELEIFSSEAIL